MNTEKRITKVKIVDPELKAAVEKADYAYNTKKDVVNAYINAGQDDASPAFTKYQAAMEEAYGNFITAKANIEKEYIFKDDELKDKQLSWTLDYSTNELTITILG